MILSAHIENFLISLEEDGKTSRQTIKNYDHYLKRFLSFAGEISPENINLDLILKYKSYLSSYLDPQHQKPLKSITQNYFMIALRAFLRYLAQINIHTISADAVKLIDAQRKSFKTLELTHIGQLLEAPDTTKIDGIRDRGILETLISSGLLVSELASLNRDTIDFLTRRFNIVGKGGKRREIYISESASFWLDKYLSLRKDFFKPLFIRFQGKVDTASEGEKMRLTTRSIERIVEKYVKALNLPFKATPQTIRHSFATGLLSNGKDLNFVKEILGHNNLSTTQVYAHSVSTIGRE